MVIGLLEHARQAARVARPEVQAVDAVGDLLGHPADVAADHGPVVQERLLDHERRVLPPARRDDHPVGLGHQARQVVVVVLPDQRDVVRPFLDLFEQLGEIVLEALGLQLEVGAVQPQVRIDAALTEQRHRLHEHVHALEVVQLPEEGDAIARAVLRRHVGLDVVLADAAVVLEPDAVTGDSPVHVAFEQELARGEEHVHVVEVRLDEALAQEELLRRDRREALVAAARRCVRAELAVGAQHLAVAMADRQELVQRVEDRRRRGACAAPSTRGRSR